MKIFGKRKPTIKSAPSSIDAGTATAKSDDFIKAAPTESSLPSEIPSYFSSLDDTDGSKTKKQRVKHSNNEVINGEEMEKLLAMDPEKLNSKQRRLVRRCKERDAANDSARDIVNDGGKSNEAIPDDDSSKQHNRVKKDSKGEDIVSKQPSETSSIKKDEKQLLSQLEGLNSKDRRKFLRQLRHDNQHGKNNNDEGKNNHDLISKLEEEAKRIAERNIRESADHQSTLSSESQEEEEKPLETSEQQLPTKSKKSKRKRRDLNDLPPEEIARREQQRQLQKEAAERRANGEATNTHRHPLNSERRRANRRKPAYRKSGSRKGDFNSVGYRMRKGV